jgi:hypothetical protein
VDDPPERGWLGNRSCLAIVSGDIQVPSYVNLLWELIENAVFAARNFLQLEFVDEFDQIVGRTLGFRYRPPGSTVNGTIVTGSEAIVITSPKLWKQVAGPLCRYSKYEIMTPRQVKRGGKLP